MKLFYQESGCYNEYTKYHFSSIGNTDYWSTRLNTLVTHKEVLCVIKFENNEMEIF